MILRAQVGECLSLFVSPSHFHRRKKWLLMRQIFPLSVKKIEMLGRGPGNQFSLENVHCVFGRKHVGVGERELVSRCGKLIFSVDTLFPSINGGQSRRDTIPVQKNAVAIRIEAVKTSLISPQSPKRVPARSPNSICPKIRLPSFHTKKFSFRQHKKSDETCNFYFPSPPRSAH